ncbi:hypothetical protein OIY81_1252 [Cryptosporidium canis]|nr:hypothetical protein OIY81_1252 [Cryptosporidium canis]
MLKAALLAAAECRIDDLSSLFNNPDIKGYWKFILNSIPETLHIDKYKHIIPEPTSIKQTFHINDKDNHFFRDEIDPLQDSVESISKWSIERCFQIVKNTLNVEEFALPFLTFMIKHLGFDVFNNISYLDDIQGKYLIKHYESILMLFSLYFILEQYKMVMKSTELHEISIDPAKFIFYSPVDRLKIVMEQFSECSYSKLNNLFSSLFKSYSYISCLNLLYCRRLNENLEYTRILKCEPLIRKCETPGYYQQILYKHASTDFYDKNLASSLLSNAYVPLEDVIISYLFDEKNSVSVEFFCQISKILVKNSILTKNLSERYISCPLKVIQFILLCIKGKSSPLLNLKALEIQEYIDEIYECTPKSVIIVQHFKKDLFFRKIRFTNLKMDYQKSVVDFICCSFCKRVSMIYNSPKSIEKFRDWQNDIFLSMESVERQQLFIDLCREFPIKMIEEMVIRDVIKVLNNPYIAECFLLNIINKLYEFYSTEIVIIIISIHKTILDSIKLPYTPFGSLLSLLFYILEKTLTNPNFCTETIIDDLIVQMKPNISIYEFKDLFLQLYYRIYNEYSEQSLVKFATFLNKLKHASLDNTNIMDPQIISIIDSVQISIVINRFTKYSPKEMEISDIFKYCHEDELEMVKCSHLWNKFEFVYYHPDSIIKEGRKGNILFNLFLSNPSLVLISMESTIWNELNFLCKRLLLLDDYNLIYNSLIRLQISTLLTYGFLNIAIKLMFSMVHNKDHFDYYIINCLFQLIKNNKYMDEITNESKQILQIIERDILKSFPPNSLSLFLSHKCTPVLDRTIRLNIKEIKENIEGYFLAAYYLDGLNSKENNIILKMLLEINYSIESSMKTSNFFETNFNKYDMLICCSADLLFMNGSLSRLIINSVNINQRTKSLVCLSLITILSIKEFIPYTMDSIKSLILVQSIIHGYSKIINRLKNNSLNNKNILKILKYENNLPIYLTKYNSNSCILRWKLLTDVLMFDEIAPTINKIDKFYSKNEQILGPSLYSYIEIDYLTKNLTALNGSNISLITVDYIHILLNQQTYICNTLQQIYNKAEKQEGVRYIYTLLLILILKYSFVKKFKKITEFPFMENYKIYEFIKLNKMFPKFGKSILHQVINGEKSIVDLLDYGKVWSNYWLILKCVKSLNKDKDLLSIFSLKLLKFIFFEDQGFPIINHKTLLTQSGNCISLVLEDVFKNLLESDCNTIQFLEMLPNNKRKLEIISLLIQISSKINYKKDRRDLLTHLNTLVLDINFKLHFPNIQCNQHQFEEIDTYRQILVFTLDLFMNSDENSVSNFIHNVVVPLNMDFSKLLRDSILLHLADLNKSEESNNILPFIKLIFGKSDSSIFSYQGVNFCDFITQLYYSTLEKMGNSLIPFIFSLELASRDIFDICLLNQLSNQVMININTLINELNLFINTNDIAVFFGRIVHLLSEKNNSVKFNLKIMIYILDQLFYYAAVICKISISLKSRDSIHENTDNHALSVAINAQKKNISELALCILSFITMNNMTDNLHFFKYWYTFGESLMNYDDQKLFYEINKKNVFVGLNSPFKKYIIISITYFRMEEVLASKHCRQNPCNSMYELICSLSIILNSESHAFLGTHLFSDLMIPILVNSKKEKNLSFNIIGKSVCDLLKIRYYECEELSLIGVLFKTLMVYRRKIINNLIPKLFALRLDHIISGMVASECNILGYTQMSTKYTQKILSKLFDKFYNVNLDSFKVGIECEVLNNHIASNNYPNLLIDCDLTDGIRFDQVLDIMYQKFLSRFYTFLFGEKQYLLDIKLANKKNFNTSV